MSDITPIVTIVDGQPRVSSIDIAEKFHKRHERVLSGIRKMITDLDSDFTEHNFVLSEYVDSTGRKLPYYSLSRDAFSLVVMGFTGKEALQWKVKYIEAFNAMEKELLNGQAKQPSSGAERMRKYRARKKLAEQQEALTASRDKFENFIADFDSLREYVYQNILRLAARGTALISWNGDVSFNVEFHAMLSDWLIENVTKPCTIQNQQFESAAAIVKFMRMLDGVNH